MRFRLTSTLTFAVALLAGLASPTAHAEIQALACCDDVFDPSSCWVPDSPNDLGECDPAAEVSMCVIEDGFAISCERIDLTCCPVREGVILLDYCEPYSAGEMCEGVVMPAPPPIVAAGGQCCRCSDVEGEAFANCEDVWTETCQPGWNFGPLVCEG